MEHTYKSHTIVITCWAILEHPSGFTPQVRITISNKSPIVTKTFQFTDRFHTKSEAESHALDVAKKWIDDTNPAIQKHSQIERGYPVDHSPNASLAGEQHKRGTK